VSNEASNKRWLKQLLPVVGVMFTVLAFFATGFPEWVTRTAVIVGAMLLLAWLFEEAGWIGRAIKHRLFRSKLRHEQSIKLCILLDDINNQFSTNCVHSPFYIWHRISNDYCDHIRMDYNYHGAIHTWLNDLKAQFEDPAFNSFLLFASLSKAVAEANRLAERVENDIEKTFLLEEVEEQDRKRLRKEWDSAKTGFNQWVSDWKILFKELNHSHKLGCVEYFRPLELVE
jgi:hypothetical protein